MASLRASPRAGRSRLPSPRPPSTAPRPYRLSGNIGTLRFTGNGTAAGWIYVTSADPNNPATIANIEASGSYVIFDHLKIGPSGGFSVGEGSDHIVLRNSEVVGTLSGGGIWIGTWSYSGSQKATNLVFDHNNVHDIGDVNINSDQDAHCITVNGAVENLWVTYNTLARCSGDAMQVEAQMGNAAKINHVYYGKNDAYGHRQSGGWVKNATDVIFSQNKAHDFRISEFSPGHCYGLQYDATNVWFLFNEGYNCAIGIDVASGDARPGAVYIIGNYIHDIPAGSNNPYDTGGMVVRSGGQAVALNNTLRNVASNGINVLPGQTLTVQNNLFAGMGSKTLYNEGTMNADHNMFQSGATFTGTTGGSSITTGDPQFVSATDPHLQGSSPAIDKGILAAAYATFQTRYGLSILVDRDGNPRPAGGAWDLGAHESLGGTPAVPTLSIGDASVTEGNSGTKTLTFSVSLSAAATSAVTVNYATANGTATAGSDYVAASGTLTFAAGTTSQTLAVTVNGDTTGEPNETFTVTLSSASGATLADASATGTLTNDDTLPTLSIGNVSVTEGNSGTKVATFNVTLSAASATAVSASYATANGTATAGSDYVALAGTVSFPAGSVAQSISITVNGDTTVEPNETFTVTLSSPTGATLAVATGTGTLTNDDIAPLPTLSIADVSVAEGNSGTKNAAFAVTLSAAASSTVTVTYATVNGTATAGSDYVATSGTLTFTAGQTAKTINVVVNGDTTIEANEVLRGQPGQPVRRHPGP